MKTKFAAHCLLLAPVFSFAGLLNAAEPPFTGGKWIDLTHDFSTNTLYWPTAKPFVLETESHAHPDKGYAFENVAGLEQLPATGAFIVALPMKIKDGSGGPLRIVAWVAMEGKL